MAQDLTLSVKLTGDGRQLSGTLKDAQGDVREFGATTEREGSKAESALRKPGQQAGTVSEHLRGAQQEARAFGTETIRGGRQANQALAQTGREAQTVTNQLGQLKAMAVGVGIAFTAMGVRDFINDTYEAVSSSQQLQASLKTVTGSVANATKAWEELLVFAAETPFTLDQSVQAFIRMQALGLNPTQAALRSFGNTAAAMGEDMMRMVEAVADATTGQFERLKAFGIRSAVEGDEIAFTFQGVTTRIRNSAADISAYLQSIGENQFAGSMADQMATLTGQSANLEDSIYQLYLAIGDAGATQMFERALGSAGNTVQFLTENIDTLASGAEVMAVLLGGRMLVAVGNVTAAKLAATQQTIAYQVALARMAGVSTAAAAGQTALAGATRAASGAMALIGGPMGAAMLAGGAIYYFREELGLVSPTVQTATGRVDDMTSALDANSQAALKNARAMLEAEQMFQRFRQTSLAMEVERQQQIVFDEQEQWNSIGGQQAFGMGQRSESQQKLHDLRVELMETRNAIEAAGGSVTEIDEKLEQLERTTREVITPTVDLGDATEGVGKKANESAKHNTTLAASYEDLLDRLNPNRRAARQFTQDLGTLNLAFATGRMSAVQYMQAMGLLHESFQEAQRETEELATTVGAEADRMATLYKRQLERMDDAAVDMHRSFLTGAEDAFGSFRRLAFDTLAEVIHAYTTRQITASIGVNAAGGGMPGAAPGGGFGINPGSLGNAWNAVQGGFNGIRWGGAGGAQAYGGGWANAATSGTGATSYWGGSMQNFQGMQGLAGAGAGFAGGYAGTQLGQSLFGKEANSSWGATGGALAGTYFGGPLGAAIGGALGGAIDSLFGSSKSNPRLNVETREADNYGHGSVREGAFGAVGFGSGTRRSNELFGGIPEEREFLAAVVASDDLLASLARSPDELNAMASAVQGVRLSASDVDGIMAQLSDRTVAAINVIDGDFGAFVASLGDDVDTIITRTQNAMAALNEMGSASASLNLQFNASADGALRAADNIAQLAGGVDQLSQLHSAYHQAYFSDAERAANLQRELTQTLGQMGYALPATRDGFRDLIEQQDRMTESGQQAYVQLLQMAGGFDQLQTMLEQGGTGINAFTSRLAELTGQISGLEDDVRRAYQVFDKQQFGMQLELLALMGDAEGALALERERELASIDESLRPMRERIWQMQDEAEAQEQATQAAQNYINELSRVRDQLSQSFGNINNWLDQQQATSGAPEVNLATAQEQLAKQLVLAENGDRDALQNITQYAQQVLDANREYNASSAAGERIKQDVFDALKDLPRAVSDAEYIVEGFRGIVSDELASEIERAIFASQYTIDTLIEFAADATRLPQDLRTILGEQAHRLDSTLSFLLGENELDAELRQLALASSNNLVATVDYIVRSQLSNNDKLIALSSSNTMTALVDYVVGADIDRDSRVLALEESNRYSAIVDMLLGLDISAQDRRLALESVNDFTAVVDYVIRSPLTGGDRRLALSSGQLYEALIGYYVDKDVTQDDRTLALNSANRYLANIEYTVSQDLSSDDRRLALNANNRYVSVIDQLIGKQIKGDDRKLALSSTNAYLTTVDAVLKRGIPDDVRTFGLANSNAIMTTVDAIIGSRIPNDVRQLAMKSSNKFITTLEAALKDGRITGDERKLLDAQSDDVVKTLKTSGAVKLSKDEWAVINAASGTQRLQLLADVAFGRTDLDHLSEIDENTKPLAERARDQLKELTGLVSEMTRTTDQFVNLNSNIVSLRDSINALGVANEEIARIEKKQVATEQLEKERIGIVREASKAQERVDTFDELADSTRPHARDGVIDTYKTYSWIDVSGSENFADKISHWGYDGRMAAWTARREVFAENHQQRLEDLRKDYRDLTGDAAPFATGGIFEHGRVVDSATRFDIGEMGEAGPEMILPVEKMSGGKYGMQARLAFDMPAMGRPLLGNNDVVEAIRDLKREMTQLRRENAQLQRESNTHLSAANNQRGAAAKGQIGAIERGNKMLKKLEDDKRLEAAKR